MSVLVINGRGGRAAKRQRNKTVAKLTSRMTRCKNGSRKHRRLLAAKKKVEAKSERRLHDFDHQVTAKAETFTRGYTIETFIKIPLGWDAGNNGWAAVLSRWGEAGKAGKIGRNTDPQEPVVSLSISNNGREPQFNCYPLNQTSPTTNWGHGLPENAWWHVAVVNDGHHTVLYVDGCPVIDNPSTESVGITTLGLTWLLGGHEYGGAVDQVFHGWIGDVRIVNRPLSVREFMIGR